MVTCMLIDMECEICCQNGIEIMVSIHVCKEYILVPGVQPFSLKTSNHCESLSPPNAQILPPCLQPLFSKMPLGSEVSLRFPALSCRNTSTSHVLGSAGSGIWTSVNSVPIMYLQPHELQLFCQDNCGHNSVTTRTILQLSATETL